MSVLQHGIAKSGVAAFYSQEIGGSLRFNMAGGPNLTRTMGTATDGKKCTISFWVKKNDIVNSTTSARFMSAYSGTGNQFHMQWGDDATGTGDQWNVSGGEQSSQQGMRMTTAPLRDPSAWYHCVWSYNSTSGSESVVLYVNGVAQTSSYTDAPTTNLVTSATKSGTVLYIGYINSSSLDIQLAEMHLIDGQALDPTSFGEFKSGAWIPKEYSGLYGNNGFYFDFTSANYSNPNMLDSSGNSNNFAASGGIDTHDFVLDSPTNNFATLNPSFYFGGSIDDGNLKHTSGGSWVGAPSTIAMSSGKWYAEFIGRDANNISVGVMATGGDTQKNLGTSNLGYPGKYSDSYGWINNFGTVYKANNDVTSPYGSAPSNDDIIRVAFDADNGELYVGKGATWFNSSDPATNTSPMYSSIPVTNTAYYFASGLENANGYWNFGQDSTFGGATSAGGNADGNGYGDFKYSVPSGYLALCTANLPTPAADPASEEEPRDYFETFTYSGNDGGQQIGDVIKKPADTTTISDSLIFNKDSHLERTMTSGDPKTWTLSMWFKRGEINADPWYPRLFDAAPASTANKRTQIGFGADGGLGFQFYDGTNNFSINFNRVFTNSSVWTHLVFVFDSRSTTTSTDRMIMYVDGVRLTPTSAGYPTDDFNSFANVSGYKMRLGNGVNDDGYDRNFSGYMAEVHYVDGAVYDADDFGNFDANGIWIPKTVTAISDYGTNGFYLDFADNTSTTTLGEDQTANGNDFTASNLATTDQVPDSPTNSYPIISGTNKNSGVTLSEGGLEFRNTGGQLHNSAIATQRLPKQGKWYWEAKVITDSSPATNAIGIVSSSYDNTPTPSGAGNFFYNEGLAWYGNTGGLFGPATYGVEVESGSATTFGNNDIIGVEYDADEKTMYFRKNGTLIDYHYVNINDSAYDFLPATSAYGDLAGSGTRGNIINFGQKTLYGTDGAGTLPTGFSLLTEDNITVNEDNLESPDWVWVKSRTQARHSGLWDSVRGVRQLLQTSSTDPETDRPGGVVDFNKNGFTLQYDTSWHYNEAGQDEVAWTWKAGTSFSNSAGTNDASIASSGSVNTVSGFSITTFTATGSNETVAHGLSAKPDMIIIIRRDAGGSDQAVYHSSLGATKNLRFNNSDEARTDSGFFNNTEPTSNVFSIGGARFADTRTYVAYCFSGKEGYSRFGLYKDSSGSDYNKDSPFIYLGFRPAWILIKSTSTGRAWAIYDNKRTPVNPAYLWLQTSTNTEQSDSTNMDIDFMANGFKIKGGDGKINTTGEEYVFAAFAEMPFKYATAR